jgi:hypothetical protein
VDQCVKRACFFEHRKARGDRTNASVPAGTLVPVVGGNSIVCYAACLAVSFDDHLNPVPSIHSGATETGSASEEVLHSARSLSAESTRLREELDRFMGNIRAA